MSNISDRSLDHDLGETADALRDTVRTFTDDKIAPIAEEIDRTNVFPPSVCYRLLLKKMKQHGGGGGSVDRGALGATPLKCSACK